MKMRTNKNGESKISINILMPENLYEQIAALAKSEFRSERNMTTALIAEALKARAAS